MIEKKELAKDETTTNLVVRDFCQNLINQEFENIITLHSTNPIRSDLMIDSIKQYEKSGRNSLMTVSVLHNYLDP